MSSLASQLQSIASLDASRLTSTGGHPSSKSYLFPAKTAASHDFDAIFSLAQSGFEELLSIDPAFSEFEQELFSEQSKRTDRMLLNDEENAALDIVLGRCLRRLGKWIGVMAGGKCIEWLVRRFRVHEMNAEVVLQVFLPYHSSPNFARILAILTIPQTSPYHAPFAPLVKKAQPVPRSYISAVIAPEREKSLRLLGDVAGMIMVAIREGTVHRPLLAFWTGIMVELLEKSRSGRGVSESLVKVLVETFVELLETKGTGVDVNAAVYPPLILLTRSVRLADEPLLAVLSSLITPDTGADASQRILTLLVLLNDRSGWTEGLGADAAVKLQSVDDLGPLLIAAMQKYGFEEAFKAILPALMQRPDIHGKTLGSIVDTATLKPDLASILVTSALTAGSGPEASYKETCRTIVSKLRERYPSIVDSAAAQVGNVDATLVNVPTGETAMLNVHAADIGARIEGIKTVLAPILEGQELSKVDTETTKSAILARLRDQDVAVLQTLYASPETQETICSLCDIKDILDAISPSFIAATLEDELVQLHLSFACNYVSKLGGSSSGVVSVFERLIFPVLLSTPGRALSSEAWHVVQSSPMKELGIVSHLTFEMLSAPATKLAETIATSTQGTVRQLTRLYSIFIDHLQSPLPNARLLAHLVLIHKIAQTTGEQQVVLASKVLAKASLLLGTEKVHDVEQAENPLSEKMLSAIKAKPDAKRTTQLASIALLAACGQVQAPADLKVNWLSDIKTPVGAKESAFPAFAVELYKWSNRDLLPASLSQSLLRAILLQLGEDALLFLASVWVSGTPTSIQVAALKHAASFIQAYADVNSVKGIDFQLIVPSTLVALKSDNKVVREAAARVVILVGKSVKEATEQVYALDTVYGERSDEVHLLKYSDLQRYLQIIASSAEDIVIDASQVAAVHKTRLGPSTGEAKKDAGHRRAIITSLLSHAVAWRSYAARNSLLAVYTSINDPTVLREVLPLLSPLADEASDESAWLAALPAKDQVSYIHLLLSCVKPSSVSVLNEMESPAWALVQTITSSTATSNIAVEMRQQTLTRMERGVFSGLNQVLKSEYIVALLKSLSALPTDEMFAVKSALGRLPVDPATIVETMTSISHPLELSSHRKRQRNEGIESDDAEEAIKELTTLLESREWKKVPADGNLLAALMSVLSTLLDKRQSIKEGIDYVEQEVLGAILALLERTDDAAELRGGVGIEVIVKVIRASTNPRTSQRALLVASELARLIPQAVLHNIMPIFTFMGASDFQRDDAYSFGVVEKTVSRLVPVMARSLQDSDDSTLDLFKRSKTFLGIFTDMASRLPRHRTLPFFVHLVKALGPDDFLAPTAMLLVERSISKSSRAGSTSAQAMDLALNVSNAYGADLKSEVVLKVVLEVTRLVDDLTKEDKEAFLNHLTNEVPLDKTIKQIVALLTLANNLTDGLFGQTIDQTFAETTVRHLLSLSGTIPTSSLADSGIPAALQSVTTSSMQLLSAKKFLDMVLLLLSDNSERDFDVALNILVERLPRVKPDVRAQNADVVQKIIKKAAGLVHPTSSLNSPALSALYAIASTAQTSEDTTLAGIVPGLVDVVGKLPAVSDQIAIMSLLQVVIRHLVSRMIPFVQSIIQCTLTMTTSATSSALAKQAFAVQSALVETVPTFLGSKQLNSILRSTFTYRAKDADVSKSLVSVVAKKIPTKTMFPVVMELWKGVQSEGQVALSGFFDLLRFVLRNADRQALPGMVKSIFAFFLDVFDLRHRLQQKGVEAEIVNTIEGSAIGSFLELVTKLNEATFKPLFIRLYDWAVIDLSEGKSINDARLVERKTVLLHVMHGLLVKFRNLLSPYIGILLPHVEELLPAYATGEIDDLPLWTLLLKVLGKSFEVDDGAYWTDALHLKLIPELIGQLSLFTDLTSTSESPIAHALASLAGSTTSEAVLKKLNTSICLLTRSDDAKERLSALRALDGIWESQTEELVQFVPETVSEFLAELLEDENSDVERLARSVLKRIEGVTGSLQEYLE